MGGEKVLEIEGFSIIIFSWRGKSSWNPSLQKWK
jgi:hypothetical protein